MEEYRNEQRTTIRREQLGQSNAEYWSLLRDYQKNGDLKRVK